MSDLNDLGFYPHPDERRRDSVIDDNRTFWQKWFSRVTAEGIITGAIPALLLGAWAWHQFIK